VKMITMFASEIAVVRHINFCKILHSKYASL
jgi:hypothetical protein